MRSSIAAAIGSSLRNGRRGWRGSIRIPTLDGLTAAVIVRVVALVTGCGSGSTTVASTRGSTFRFFRIYANDNERWNAVVSNTIVLAAHGGCDVVVISG